MVKQLLAQPITSDTFAAYGQVIFACEDGKLYDASDAQLELKQGIPRFYIMRLQNRGQTFSKLTRHVNCTQCLGALEGKEWLMAVAPPSASDQPDVEAIAAFRIPGHCFIKLHLGTWHAGPFFESEFVDFYNLELSDTNITDHTTYDFSNAKGITFEIK